MHSIHLKSISSDWRTLHGEHFRGRRVLITGGAGFIGSHIAEALLALGASVVVLDDLSAGSLENLESMHSLKFVNGSILDRAILADCMAGCEYVFHQAALGSVPRSVEQPALYHSVNATGTLAVLQVARDQGVRRVMFAASSSAYGDNPVPWIESMPVLPRSPYAATKVAGESLLCAFSASYGLETVSLRYFNIFGPRQNANNAYAAVIAAFAKSLLAGERPTIFGDGQQSRDFTFVHNAVHANLLAARTPAALAGEVINVGCGSSISVIELARLMAEVLDRTDLTPAFQQERPGDLKHSFADLRKSQNLLGYEPIVQFRSGLRATVGWYGSGLIEAARPAMSREVQRR